MSEPGFDEDDDDEVFHPHNPIQQQHKRAVELSGVSLKDAFAIDEGRNIGRFIPDYVLTSLCEEFYKKVYASDEDSKGKNPEWFRKLFQNKTIEESTHDLSEYLIQR